MKFVTRAIVFSSLLSTGTFAFADVPVIDGTQEILEAPHANQAYVESQGNEESRATLLETVNRMQQEIQSLRGQLEVQAHDLKMMQQQQEAFYKDIDARISTNAPNTPAPPSTVAAPAQPVPTPAVKPEPTIETKVLPPPTTRNNSALAETTAFAQASEYVTAKKYSLAQESLQQYLQKYPDSANAPTAHYWLGELYLVNGDNPAAIREFDIITKKFPESKKCASALLKLGFVYFDQGELVKSRAVLQEVIKRFPNTTDARLATNRLQAIEDVMK